MMKLLNEEFRKPQQSYTFDNELNKPGHKKVNFGEKPFVL